MLHCEHMHEPVPWKSVGGGNLLLHETLLHRPDTTYFSNTLPLCYRATRGAGVVSANMSIMRAHE